MSIQNLVNWGVHAIFLVEIRTFVSSTENPLRVLFVINRKHDRLLKLHFVIRVIIDYVRALHAPARVLWVMSVLRLITSWHYLADRAALR